MSNVKPTLEEVLRYAERQIGIFVSKFGASLPREHKEEMAQVARLRVFESYERIDPSRGWKSFTQRHCRGAILDYLRWGEGFEEIRMESKNKPEPKNGHHRLRKRIQITKQYDDGEWEVPIEIALGMLGIVSTDNDETKLKPKWDLVARMARIDADVHLVAKLLLGFTQTELSSMFMVSRERLTQRLQEFCRGLDAPEHYYGNWTSQKIYAFGLSKYFFQEERDLGFGWEYDPVDLYARDINYIVDLNPQMYFKIVIK